MNELDALTEAERNMLLDTVDDDEGITQLDDVPGIEESADPMYIYNADMNSSAQPRGCSSARTSFW